MIYAEVTASPKTLPGCSSQLSASAASSSGGTWDRCHHREIHPLDAGHFAWEQAAEENGSLVVHWVGGGYRAIAAGYSNRDRHAITRPADAAGDDTQDRRALTQQPRPWSEAIRKQSVT
jgi:hypothetical protein